MNNKLLGDFYDEISSTYSDQNQDDFKCLVRLSEQHPIYKGHFEGFPVAPGVCMIHIVKELMVNKFQKNLLMHECENIKFLVLINPAETSEFDIRFLVKKHQASMDVNAVFTNKGTACLKFKGSFRLEE